MRVFINLIVLIKLSINDNSNAHIDGRMSVVCICMSEKTIPASIDFRGMTVIPCHSVCLHQTHVSDI